MTVKLTSNETQVLACIAGTLPAKTYMSWVVISDIGYPIAMFLVKDTAEDFIKNRPFMHDTVKAM